MNCPVLSGDPDQATKVNTKGYVAQLGQERHLFKKKKLDKVNFLNIPHFEKWLSELSQFEPIGPYLKMPP